MPPHFPRWAPSARHCSYLARAHRSCKQKYAWKPNSRAHGLIFAELPCAACIGKLLSLTDDCSPQLWDPARCLCSCSWGSRAERGEAQKLGREQGRTGCSLHWPGAECPPSGWAARGQQAAHNCLHSVTAVGRGPRLQSSQRLPSPPT